MSAPEQRAYRVHLVALVSTSVEVQAEDEHAAGDRGLDAAPATPGGNLGDWYDSAGDGWEIASVEDVETGEAYDEPTEVDTLRNEVTVLAGENGSLREEVERLRKRLALAEAGFVRYDVQRNACTVTREFLATAPLALVREASEAW